MRYALLSLACLIPTANAGEQWQVDLRPQLEKFGLKPQTQGKRGTCSVFAVTGVCEFEWSRFARDREYPIDLSTEFRCIDGKPGTTARYFVADY